MRWSKLFIPTLREDPAEGDPAVRLLIRAGYIRRIPTGGFAFLPLARRVLRKIVQIIREEMDAIGGQEFHVERLLPLARELRSYKQLPQIWYHFQEELESFSIDIPGEISFGAHESAFRRILKRCEVSWLDDPEGDSSPEEFPTPNVKSIAEIAAFTGLPETSQIKSLAMVADGKPIMALLRGDQQLSEAKLLAATEASQVRPATPDEIRSWFGADAGSLGPVGAKAIPIVADESLRGRRNMICGANKNDFHLRNVTPAEDFAPEFRDLERDESADLFRSRRMMPFDLRVTNEAGEEIVPFVARHTLSLERLLFAIADQHRDKDGLILPPSVAPYCAIVTPVFYADEAQQQAAAQICSAPENVLLDDRDERPGVKFKDGDLIGIPYRINIGKKLAHGLVEVVDRASKQVTDVPLADSISFIRGSARIG